MKESTVCAGAPATFLASDADAERAALARDVRECFASRPRRLPSRWLWDAAGSALFERICDQPEYYLTRSEDDLLARVAGEVAASTRAEEVVDLGCGSARKSARLVSALQDRGQGRRYVPVDVSAAALDDAGRTLGRLVPGVQVAPHRRDFTGGLPPGEGHGPRLALFLGSTLGNFEPPADEGLLRDIARTMRPRDRLLLGADLAKPRAVLEAAYDDAAGVTAAFNRNLLVRLDRELDADFNPADFAHRALFVPGDPRIEMHLVATRDLQARIGALDLRVAFRRGESLRTEICRKFTRRGIDDLLARAGLDLETWWPSPDRRVALALARTT